MVVEDPPKQDPQAPPVGQQPLKLGGELANNTLFLHQLRRDQRLNDQQRTAVEDQYDRAWHLLGTMSVGPDMDARDSAAALMASMDADNLVFANKPSMLGYSADMDKSRQETFDKNLPPATRADIAAARFMTETGGMVGPAVPADVESFEDALLKIRRREFERSLQGALDSAEQVVTRRQGGGIFGLFTDDSALPITSVTVNKRKFSGLVDLPDFTGLRFTEDQPEDQYLVSKSFKNYPIFNYLEQGNDALQIMNPKTPIQEDEEGMFIETTMIDGKTIKRHPIPFVLQDWGSEILESITSAEMGIPEHPFGESILAQAMGEANPAGLTASRFVLGRNQLIGSVWHWVGAGGVKGIDYDVPSLMGTMPFVPNITGNKLRDRALLLDPIAIRMMQEADSEGVFGNVVGQTLVGMGEFALVQATTRGLFGLGARALKATPVLRGVAGGRLANFYARNLDKIRVSVEGLPQKQTAGKIVRGLRGSGLNFGTLGQFRQEVWFGMVQSLWQPGSNVGEGFRQGVEEGTVEFAFGYVGSPRTGLMSNLFRAIKRRLPNLRARKARATGVDTKLRKDPPVLDPQNPRTAGDAFEEDLVGHLGYLPSSDEAILQSLRKRFKNKAHIDNALELLDMYWVGLQVGAYFSARDETLAAGEQWDPFSAKGIGAIYGKIATFDPQAWGTATGFAALGGAYYGANAIKGGPLATQVPISETEYTTMGEALAEISEYIAAKAQTPSEADIAFIRDQLRLEDLAKEFVDADAPFAERPAGSFEGFAGYDMGGRAITPGEIEAFSTAHGGRKEFTGTEVREWLKKNPQKLSSDPPNHTTYGFNAERNFNKGRTRLDPEYRLTAGEQLAIYFTEADGGPELVAEAMTQLDTAELLHIDRQLRATPETLQTGEIGASRVAAGTVQDMLRAILVSRRRGEGPDPETGPGPIPDEPTPPTDQQGPTGNRILDRDDNPEIEQETQAARTALEAGKTWSPTADSVLQVRQLKSGEYEVVNTETGKVHTKSTPDLAKAVRQVFHIRKNRTGVRKRGTRGSVRAKVQTEMDPDEGFSGAPAEVERAFPARLTAPETQQAIQEVFEQPPPEDVIEVEAIPIDSPEGETPTRTVSTRGLVLGEDVRRDLRDDTAEQREFHVEQMLLADVQGAGFNNLHDARAAARFGTLPDNMDPNVVEVLEGRAEVPTSAQLQQAFETIVDQHAGMPGTARDFDGGAHRVAMRYLGGAAARNTNRLQEALQQAAQAAQARTPAAQGLLPPESTAELAGALRESQEEAGTEGFLDSGLSAASLQASLAEEDTKRAELRAGAREQERQHREGKAVPGPRLQDITSQNTGADLPPVGPSFDGTLFDPRSSEDVIYYEGTRAFMRGQAGGDRSGFMSLVELAMHTVGRDAQSQGQQRALRNGAIMGTQGNPKLLGFVDLVFGQSSGSAKTSYNLLVKDSLDTHGDRIREVLSTLTVATKEGSRPLFTDSQMRNARTMEPFAIAALGVTLQLRDGVETTYRRSSFARMASDMIGERGASAVEQMSSARQYLLGIDSEGKPHHRPIFEGPRDQQDQAAGWLVTFGKRLRKHIDDGVKWKRTRRVNPQTGQSDVDGAIGVVDIRGKMAERIVRAVTGKRGFQSTLGTLPELQTREKNPRMLATQIIEDLSGVPPISVSQSVGRELHGISQASSEPARVGAGDVRFDQLSEDVRLANKEDGIGTMTTDQLAVEAMASSNYFGQKVWSELKQIINPSTGTPLVSADHTIDSEYGSTLLHAISDDTSRLHSRVRDMVVAGDPLNGDRVFQRLVRDARRGRESARQLGLALWLDDAGNKETPNSLGQSEFEALDFALERRARNPQGYGGEWTAEEVSGLAEFGLLEEHETPEGETWYVLSQGRVNDLGHELSDRLSRLVTNEDVRADLEQFGDNVLLYSFDPLQMIYGGHPRRGRIDPDKWWDNAVDATTRVLHRASTGEAMSVTKEQANAAQRAVMWTSNLMLDTKGFVATRLGRTSKSKLKSPLERKQDFASKRSMANGKAIMKRLREQATLLIANTMAPLGSKERDLFVPLIESGDWLKVEGPQDLANKLGIPNAEHLFSALSGYNTGILQLGRDMVMAGGIPHSVFAAFTTNEKTKYIMRAYWPGADGIPKRVKELESPEAGGASGREMLRETHPAGDSTLRITDPSLLTSKVFAQESARIGLYSVLRDMGNNWGIPSERAPKTIPPHLRRNFRVAAVPPGVDRDPFNGKRVEKWQHALFQMLESLQTQIASNQVHNTPIKQGIIDRLLTRVDPDERAIGRMDTWSHGVLISDTSGKQLEVLLDDFFAQNIGQNLLDDAAEMVDLAAKFFRRGRTALSFMHVTMSTMSSFMTNHMAGTAGLGDVLDGFLRNRGPYTDATKGMELYQDYVRGGRSWDLAQMGDDGALIAKTSFFMHRMGGTTLTSTMLDSIDMRDTFHHLVEADPNFAFQLEKSGTSADLINAMMRDTMGRRLTSEKVDKAIAQALGNVGAGPEAMVEGIHQATSFYEANEFLMKFAAFLALVRDNPVQAATRSGREVLADDGISATADYSEANPWLYEMTARFRLSSVRKAFTGDKKAELKDAGWYMARLNLGQVFLSYNFVIFPTLSRAMASGYGRGALRALVPAAVLAGLATALTRFAFGDDDQQLEQASRSNLYPSLEWSDEVEALWNQKYQGRHPGVMGPVDASGLDWMTRRELKKFHAKVGAGMAFVHAGPSGDGRARLIDMTQITGGGPLEVAMRGLQGKGIGSMLFDDDPGRARSEGMLGWLWQQAFAMRALNPFGPREKDRTRGEAATVEMLEWLQRNIGSDMNPTTAILSKTSMRFFEAMVLGGTPLREAVRGIRRPEAEAQSIVSRVGTAALSSIFHVREVPDRTVYSSRYFDTVEQLNTFVVGSAGYRPDAAGFNEQRRIAGIMGKRSMDAIRGQFRGAFELVKKEGAFSGGMNAHLFPKVAIWQDIESVIDDTTGLPTWQLLPGRTDKELSELGRFIRRQDPEHQHYAIDHTLRALERAFDSDAYSTLAFMADRRDVGGAIAIRIFDGLISPKKDDLLNIISQGVAEGKGDADNTWLRVWFGFVDMVDREADLDNAQRRTYDSLVLWSQRAALSHPDAPSVKEVLGSKRFDLLPLQSAVEERR